MDFEHVSNAACLELTNSVPDRWESWGRDWLGEPGLASEWMRSLDLEVAAEPSPSDLDRLREFREVIFSVFASLASGKQVQERPLATITKEHAAGLLRHGFRSGSPGVERDWPQKWDTAGLIALFADSAVRELTGVRLDRSTLR